MRRIFAVLLFLFSMILLCACADDGGGDEGNNDSQETDGDFDPNNSDGDTDGDTDPQNTDGDEIEQTRSSVSETIQAEDGGALELTTDQGDVVTLNIPAGALAEETEITMTWLDEVPASPLQDVAFALRFEPDGLAFSTPARLTIDHATAFDENDDLTLFWIVSAEHVLALTTDAVTSKTEVLLDHFSDYAGAKPDKDMEWLCTHDINWLDPASICRDNWPAIITFMKCGAWASRNGKPSQEFIEQADSFMSRSFDKMRAKAVPEDDYCARGGSEAADYLKGLASCMQNQSGTDTPGFLSEETVEKVQKGFAEAATELAQAWLDSDPPSGDSCYKLGEVQTWMEYSACLANSPSHSIDNREQFGDHMLEGRVVVQKEFLQSPQPANHDELCGWYLDCLDMHVQSTGITRDLVADGEVTAQNLEQRYSEVSAECLSLWDVRLELSVTNHYEFSGMEGHDADYTVTVNYEDISIEAERESLQTAAGSVNELSGFGPGSTSTEGERLNLPFFSTLGNGSTLIQMSYFLTENEVSSWSVNDNGSEYNCIQDWACAEITDFEVRKKDPANYPDRPENLVAKPSIQFMVMRSRAEQELSWAGLTLPQNTGYLIWRMENLVDYCKYDSDEGEWDCDSPTMGTIAEPRPGTDAVVSDAQVPDFHFFNAYLSPQQVRKFIDHESFSFNASLSNDLSVNDGAVTETETAAITVTLIAK